jgi:hypothetical protein
MTFAERAALVTKYGIPVMPVKPRDKKTVLNDWPQRATTDPVQIAEWDKENPDYNCGAVGRPREFLIFDADRFISLSEQIERETKHHLDSIDTLMVQSSEGKMHLYFKHDARSEALGNVSDKDENGEIFSVRAHNMYVVAPGSVHPKTGSAYEVVAEPTFGDIPVVPNWLMDWLEKAKRRITKQKAKIAADEGAQIPEGGRDEFLFAEACKLRDAKVSRKVALVALKAINTDRCVPPMAESDIAIKIKSAYTRESRVKPVNDVSRDEVAPTNTPIAEPESESVLRFVRADSIKPKKIRWLWHGRIPLGKITLFAGNPDNGKSVVGTDVAAHVTACMPFPDSIPNFLPPCDVLMLLGEDDLADTAVPRLMAAKADMKRIIFQPVDTDSENEIQLRLDIHLPLIEKHLEANPDIRLIIIDPISNYLGKASMVAEQEMRAVLIPLKRMAERRNVAIVLVMHLNKKADLDAISRVGGAMAFIGVSRCSWLFTRDTSTVEGKATDSFSMSRIKNNLVAATNGGLSFRLEGVDVPLENGDSTNVPHVVWGGVIQKSADDVLQRDKRPGRPPAQQNAAVRWINEYLHDGAKLLDDVYYTGRKKHGFSQRTIDRAREAANICTFASGKQKAKDGKEREFYSCKLQPEEDI